MYPLDLKSVAYESEYISTGNISRNIYIYIYLSYVLSMRLIFLKCLFTLRCERKAREGRAGLCVAGYHSRYFSLETSTLPRSSIQARTNLCFFLPPPPPPLFFLCLALIYPSHKDERFSRSFEQIYGGSGDCVVSKKR